jgi:hypothetical protein
MRGGNRYLALIPLEMLAIAVIAAIASSRQLAVRDNTTRAVLLLAASPLLIAVVQLAPVFPPSLWARLPGHAAFRSVLSFDASQGMWHAITVSPDATEASLLAGLPLSAALLAGYFASLSQMRVLFRVCVAVALVQVLLSVLQLGATGSFLMFGAATDPPVGTFGNRNHVGEYLAVCACCWIWLSWGSRRDRTTGPWIIGAAIWKSNAARVLVALVLLAGLVISKSRTAIVLGICATILCVAVTRLTRRETPWYWHWVPAVALVLLALLLWLIGADPVVQRFGSSDLGGAADFRLLLAKTTWQAALAFFPFGSGWGTFDLVYPRFQPPEIARFANHAHMDFAELLLEGGVLFLAFAGLFAVLAARRVLVLVRGLAQRHHATREVILSTFCGIGLAIVLVHSTVDFPLRIPANAILAALLAGAYLRPLPGGRSRKSVAPVAPAESTI